GRRGAAPGPGSAARAGRWRSPRRRRGRRAGAAWGAADRPPPAARAAARWRGWARSWSDDGTTGEGAVEDEVVAVHDLVVVVGAQDRGDLARVPPRDAREVGRGVVREADGDALALALDGHGVAEGELPAHAHDPAREQAPPGEQRVAGAGVDEHGPGDRLVEDPGLPGGHALARQEARADVLATRQRLEPGPSPAEHHGLDAGVG